MDELPERAADDCYSGICRLDPPKATVMVFDYETSTWIGMCENCYLVRWTSAPTIRLRDPGPDFVYDPFWLVAHRLDDIAAEVGSDG